MSAIGSARKEAATVFQRFGLAPFRKMLTPDDFDAAATRIGCLPQRCTCILVPEVVVWLVVYAAIRVSSMRQGLLDAWGLVRAVVPTLRQAPVTEEAFTLARRALPIAFWRFLFRLFVHRFATRFRSRMLFKGLFRVLAGDGTKIDLPKAARLGSFFGYPKNQQGKARTPQARIVSFGCVFTGLCVDFALMPLRICEHLALRHLIKRLHSNDLLLLDAGFFSYAALWLIPRKKAHYLLRLSGQMAGYAKPIPQPGRNDRQDDQLVRFCPGAAARRNCPGLPKELVCRLIRYRLPGFRESYLVTSLLDAQQFTTAELVELYHLRWRIETLYRELKHVLDIQNVRGLDPAAVSKEIYANLLLANLTRGVMNEACEGTELKPMQLSFKGSVKFVERAIVQMSVAPSRNLDIIYGNLLEDIRSQVIPQRPGRSYPRRQDGKVKDMGKGKTKKPARLAET